MLKLNKTKKATMYLLICINYFRIIRMIKSPAWNKSSGWTLVLGLVLNLLADPAEAGEHQRRETVRKSKTRNLIETEFAGH